MASGPHAAAPPQQHARRRQSGGAQRAALRRIPRIPVFVACFHRQRRNGALEPAAGAQRRSARENAAASEPRRADSLGVEAETDESRGFGAVSAGGREFDREGSGEFGGERRKRAAAGSRGVGFVGKRVEFDEFEIEGGEARLVGIRARIAVFRAAIAAGFGAIDEFRDSNAADARSDVSSRLRADSLRLPARCAATRLRPVALHSRGNLLAQGHHGCRHSSRQKRSFEFHRDRRPRKARNLSNSIERLGGIRADFRERALQSVLRGFLRLVPR